MKKLNVNSRGEMGFYEDDGHFTLVNDEGDFYNADEVDAIIAENEQLQRQLADLKQMLSAEVATNVELRNRVAELEKQLAECQGAI